MTAIRKIVDFSTLEDHFDLPPDFKNKKIEVLLSPVAEKKDKTTSSYINNFPSFTKSQIESWANTPEIQNLLGVLNATNLPVSISISDIRNMRLTEK